MFFNFYTKSQSKTSETVSPSADGIEYSQQEVQTPKNFLFCRYFSSLPAKEATFNCFLSVVRSSVSSHKNCSFQHLINLNEVLTDLSFPTTIGNPERITWISNSEALFEMKGSEIKNLESNI